MSTCLLPPTNKRQNPLSTEANFEQIFSVKAKKSWQSVSRKTEPSLCICTFVSARFTRCLFHFSFLFLWDLEMRLGDNESSTPKATERMHSRISTLSTLSRMVSRYHRHSVHRHFSLKKEQQSISEIASVAIRCRRSSFRNFCSAREFPCHISRIYALNSLSNSCA